MTRSQTKGVCWFIKFLKRSLCFLISTGKTPPECSGEWIAPPKMVPFSSLQRMPLSNIISIGNKLNTLFKNFASNLLDPVSGGNWCSTKKRGVIKDRSPYMFQSRNHKNNQKIQGIGNTCQEYTIYSPRPFVKYTTYPMIMHITSSPIAPPLSKKKSLHLRWWFKSLQGSDPHDLFWARWVSLYMGFHLMELWVENIIFSRWKSRAKAPDLCKLSNGTKAKEHLIVPATWRSSCNESGRATSFPIPCASVLHGWQEWRMTRMGSSSWACNGDESVEPPPRLKFHGLMLKFRWRALCPKELARRPRLDCFCISVLIVIFLLKRAPLLAGGLRGGVVASCKQDWRFID